MLELDVVNVCERAGNIVGAALRDLVHDLGGATLPPNDELSPLIVEACVERVRTDCGIELLSTVVTGDALTDGYLLSTAIAPRSPEGEWDAASAVLAARLSVVG